MLNVAVSQCIHTCCFLCSQASIPQAIAKILLQATLVGLTGNRFLPAGTNAQSLASTVPTAPAAYNTAAQQSGAAVGNTQSLASTVPTVPSSYNTGAQQNMAASSNGAGAASSVNANNGVLSGTTYQSSGATSPLTPYNTVSALCISCMLLSC